jgi:hypothetical protein
MMLDNQNQNQNQNQMLTAIGGDSPRALQICNEGTDGCAIGLAWTVVVDGDERDVLKVPSIATVKLTSATPSNGSICKSQIQSRKDTN